MSTKDLARTLIEGGRRYYNNWERRESHAQERSLTRTYLARASSLEDGFDALAIDKRPKVPRDFHDKLAAPRRWLRSQAGRPWDKVRALMFQRFDPRSLAGQHIIYDHLLGEVQLWGEDHHPARRWRRFYVDAHGILRAPLRPRRKPLRKARANGPQPSAAEVYRWADGRRVGARGTHLYWFTHARDYHDHDPTAEPRERLRQARELTASEREFWQRVSACDKRDYELKP